MYVARQLWQWAAGGQDAGPCAPRPEAFNVIARKLGQRTPHGGAAGVGHTMNGHTAGTPMQVINAGTTDLGTLIMFVVDATEPISAPITLP